MIFLSYLKMSYYKILKLLMRRVASGQQDVNERDGGGERVSSMVYSFLFETYNYFLHDLKYLIKLN